MASLLGPNEAINTTGAGLYGQAYPGRYWYDRLNGLWGAEGGPAAGQLMPGLSLGGALQPSASGGGTGRLTGIFINGREIHPQDQAMIVAVYGYSTPGRYWMDAQGWFGFEGQPALTNFAADAARAMNANSGYTGLANGGYASSNSDGTWSIYSPGTGGGTGMHAGQASDGCTYVIAGDYSNDFC